MYHYISIIHTAKKILKGEHNVAAETKDYPTANLKAKYDYYSEDESLVVELIELIYDEFICIKLTQNSTSENSDRT